MEPKVWRRIVRLILWIAGIATGALALFIGVFAFLFIGTRDAPRPTDSWHGMMRLGGAIQGYQEPWIQAREHSVDQGCLLFHGWHDPQETSLTCERFLLTYDEAVERRSRQYPTDESPQERINQYRSSHQTCMPFYAGSFPTGRATPFGSWSRILVLAFRENVSADDFLDIETRRLTPPVIDPEERTSGPFFDYTAADVDLIDQIECNDFSAFLIRAEGRSFVLE